MRPSTSPFQDTETTTTGRGMNDRKRFRGWGNSGLLILLDGGGGGGRGPLERAGKTSSVGVRQIHLQHNRSAQPGSKKGSREHFKRTLSFQAKI